MYSTFTGWTAEDDKSKIGPVLAKFEAYCQPLKNIPFERYRFNRRVQEPGETYDHYCTALQQLAESCDFATITPDEILRHRLVFGIWDAKARERLLRESKLTLKNTDKICRAAESMLAQLKVMEDSSSAAVSAVKSESDQQQTSAKEGNTTREYWNCGRRHEFHKRELCPAYGKTCNKCCKPNHFAAKCCSKSNTKSVKSVNDDEIYQAHVCGTNTDDSQFVTLKLEVATSCTFKWIQERNVTLYHCTRKLRKIITSLV